jgi:TonB family protein
MTRSAVITLDSSKYGAFEIKRHINKSTIRGYIVAVLIMLSFTLTIYYLKENVVIVPKVMPPITIPIDNFNLDNPKLPPNQLPNGPKLTDFKSIEVAGKYTPVNEDLIDQKSPDIASMGNQGISSPIGGKDDSGGQFTDEPTTSTATIIPIESEPSDEPLFDLEKDVAFSYEELQMSVIYPETARKAGIEGQVVVQALIGKDGKVLKTRILSSENKYLNEAAEKAIFNFKGFSPAIQNKSTVAVWIAIPIKFKMR